MVASSVKPTREPVPPTSGQGARSLIVSRSSRRAPGEWLCEGSGRRGADGPRRPKEGTINLRGPAPSEGDWTSHRPARDGASDPPDLDPDQKAASRAWKDRVIGDAAAAVRPFLTNPDDPPPVRDGSAEACLLVRRTFSEAEWRLLRRGQRPMIARTGRRQDGTRPSRPSPETPLATRAPSTRDVPSTKVPNRHRPRRLTSAGRRDCAVLLDRREGKPRRRPGGTSRAK
jgi:hypothetical protein